MSTILKGLKDLLRGEGGATAVEYSVMLVLIIAVAVITVAVLGIKVEGLINKTDALFGNSVSNG